MREEVTKNHNFNQDEIGQMLVSLSFDDFDSGIDNLAFALGRTADEIDAMIEGRQPIDEDLAIKIRGIARNRYVSAD